MCCANNDMCIFFPQKPIIKSIECLIDLLEKYDNDINFLGENKIRTQSFVGKVL